MRCELNASLDTGEREAREQIVELFHLLYRPEQSFSRLISRLIEDSQLASNFRSEFLALARVIPPGGLFPKVVPIDYDPRERNIQRRRLSRSRQANNTVISKFPWTLLRGLAETNFSRPGTPSMAWNFSLNAVSFMRDYARCLYRGARMQICVGLHKCEVCIVARHVD